MSLVLTRWSTLPDDTARAAFLERFERCASELRVGPHREHAPSPAYTARVLQLALQRPAELFLAQRDDTVVARAAGVCSTGRDGAGVLGLYEAALGRQGDLGTKMILDAAIPWAASQGIEELSAPVDVNTWFSYRFPVPPTSGECTGTETGTDTDTETETQTETRTRALAPWEPTQPPEYLERFRKHGFEEAEHYQTRFFGFPTSGEHTLSDVVRRSGTALEAARAAGFSFHRLDDGVSVPTFLEELYPLCLEAFGESPLFEPVSREVFRALHEDALTRPEANLAWARDAEGRLVGFIFAFRQASEMVIKTVAVAPSARGSRLSRALVHFPAKAAAEAGMHTLISALIRRGNTSEYLGRAHLMPGVETWTQDYVLLRRSVGP